MKQVPPPSDIFLNKPSCQKKISIYTTFDMKFFVEFLGNFLRLKTRNLQRVVAFLMFEFAPSINFEWNAFDIYDWMLYKCTSIT